MGSTIQLTVVRDRLASGKVNAGNDFTGAIVQNTYNPPKVKGFQSSYISNYYDLSPSNSMVVYGPPNYNGSDYVVVTEAASAISAKILS